MNIPLELIWGVDVAVKKLRPGAHFQLEGTNFTEWNDPTGAEPPLWEEVLEQMQKDQRAAEDWIAANSSN